MAKPLLTLTAAVLMSAFGGRALAQKSPEPYVQVAELKIDPAQLENYKAEVLEQIRTATHVEPGVLVLYAVAHQDDPTHVTVFEVYASKAAYQAHLESPHFKKYKAATQNMVKSLKLIPATPIVLGDKSN